MEEALLWRRLVAELLGSAFLAAVVIGSGIAAQQLSPGNTGLELLENAAATAAGLYAIILMFGPVSARTSIRWSPSLMPPSEGFPGEQPPHTCRPRWSDASGVPSSPT